MGDLLPYYERALGILRQSTGEFSERDAQTAGQLLDAGKSAEDRHVEWLIESFALLAARRARRLDAAMQAVVRHDAACQCGAIDHAALARSRTGVAHRA